MDDKTHMNFDELTKCVEKIRFTKHFLDRIMERPISESLVREYLSNPSKLYAMEDQGDKYKLWFRMSRKYCLVVVVALRNKDLYIITAWKTKWQK